MPSPSERLSSAWEDPADEFDERDFEPRRLADPPIACATLATDCARSRVASAVRATFSATRGAARFAFFTPRDTLRAAPEARAPIDLERDFDDEELRRDFDFDFDVDARRAELWLRDAALDFDFDVRPVRFEDFFEDEPRRFAAIGMLLADAGTKRALVAAAVPTRAPSETRGRRRRPCKGRTMSATLFTIGHGTLSLEGLLTALRSAGVDALVDVRAYPRSRHNPQFNTDSLSGWLAEQGIAYRWVAALGGRRRAAADSPNVALRNDAFRAYADYMGTSEFRAAFDALVAAPEVSPTAIMCSETVWWRCHRRLIADAAELLRSIPVEHIMPGGKRTRHRLTEGVRRVDDRLVYDVTSPS